MAEIAVLGDGVKSADRAMAILELFRDLRRPASAREIAEGLAMPRSSTNVLLRSLIAGGYLRYDEARSDYFPTLRVFQLGSWLIESFFNDPRIDAAMRTLGAATGETVCLWTQVGVMMTVMTVIDSPQAIALAIRPGVSAPLFGSAVGLALLAALERMEVEVLHARAMRAAAGRDEALPDLLKRVAAIRRQGGTSVGYDFWLPDAGAAACAFRHPALGEQAVLAVGGPVFRIRRNEEAVRAALEQAIATLRAM